MNLIVDFTPTGMIPTKGMTPHVPLMPEEIIKDVKQAVAASGIYELSRDDPVPCQCHE